MGRLQNKVALITGGNTGIGRGVAFADGRADVAVAFHGHRTGQHEPGQVGR